MKNKKGFTLTELLIVLVLLVSISTLSIVEVVTLQNRSKERRLNELITEIEEAADIYINTDMELVSSILNDGVEECTTIRVLQEEGLLKRNLINPMNEEEISNNLCVNSKAVNGVIVNTFSLE